MTSHGENEERYLNYRLIEALRARKNEWCDAGELSDHLFTDKAILLSDAELLDGAGYHIERDGENRLRLVDISDRLITYEISRSLGTQIIGSSIHCIEETASTNDEAWALAARGRPEGSVIFAEHQKRGRGRFGRAWQCPPGMGILFSILLRPDIEPDHTSVLTIMGSVAVADTLNEYAGVPALIKWPNDIMARGCKLGGILVETRRDSGTLRTAPADCVLGIGINVNIPAERMPKTTHNKATSLMEQTDRMASRIALARELLRSLDRWYQALIHGRYAHITEHWRQYSSTLGSRIVVEQNGRRFTGRVLDISIEEGLIIRLDWGGTMIFDPATVTVVS